MEKKIELCELKFQDMKRYSTKDSDFTFIITKDGAIGSRNGEMASFRLISNLEDEIRDGNFRLILERIQ